MIPSLIKNLKDLNGLCWKVWIAICGGFILLVGVLSANGGLTWTDKALQLKQAQTRVIDMNAVPEKGANIMKY